MKIQNLQNYKSLDTHLQTVTRMITRRWHRYEQLRNSLMDEQQIQELDAIKDELNVLFSMHTINCCVWELCEM